MLIKLAGLQAGRQVFYSLNVSLKLWFNVLSIYSENYSAFYRISIIIRIFATKLSAHQDGEKAGSAGIGRAATGNMENAVGIRLSGGRAHGLPDGRNEGKMIMANYIKTKHNTLWHNHQTKNKSE